MYNVFNTEKQKVSNYSKLSFFCLKPDKYKSLNKKTMKAFYFTITSFCFDTTLLYNGSHFFNESACA